MSPQPRRRRPLVAVLVALTTLVATLVVALTGLVTWQTAEHGAEQREREALARQATVLSRLPALSQQIFHGAQVLGGPNGVQIAVIDADGSMAGGAAPAVDVASRARLLAGQPVSTSGILAGQEVLLVGHPGTGGGAVVLTEPHTVVDGNTDQVRRSALLPLLAGMLGAGLAGAVLARRITRPLTTAARAAHRLADGERGVAAEVSGPRETAEIARALNVLDAALTRSENRQRDFLLSVSHDLRTPLTALQGYAEALADGLIEPADVPAAGRTLAEETSRLDRFLGDLLALARLEADDFRLDVAATDLASVVRRAAAFWTGPCARDGVELRIEEPGPGERAPVVDTDAFRVRQLLDGLVQNALRVTPEGGRLVLCLRAAPSGRAELEVRDSGPGLTDDDVRVAFDAGALHQRYRAVRPSGSGLGLAIAQRLTARLGGTIGVRGHGPEGGACFTVTLPRGRPEPPGRYATG
ncbi:ATP-binding protein [Peterkaempfera sp. SMS 1(5)a]|uniref:sensor histidine kinase n=1 Tax=Peterkaempfera podocarpi TaxID=3232308 RepID=UPI00366BA69C